MPTRVTGVGRIDLVHGCPKSFRVVLAASSLRENRASKSRCRGCYLAMTRTITTRRRLHDIMLEAENTDTTICTLLCQQQ